MRRVGKSGRPGLFVGTTWLGLHANGFALLNVVLVVAWLRVVALLLRRHREVSAAAPAPMAEAARA